MMRLAAMTLSSQGRPVLPGGAPAACACVGAGLVTPLASRTRGCAGAAVGNGTPDGMQLLLNAATCDTAGVRDDVCACVAGISPLVTVC